ncbi:MAG: biopolymer transporter ExbD, partial [Planctomycetes bacterium]|nr:biopolymer transporter ExbD [Planctomycetota bacterium]
MIDCVFQLLIFFMIATQFSQLEVDKTVTLPEASASKADQRSPGTTLVNVRQDGQVTVDNVAYAFDQLGPVMAEIAEKNPDQAVVIRADEMAYHQYFLGVMQACAQAKLWNVRVAARMAER